MTSVLLGSQCDQCGQFDDHPKLHYYHRGEMATRHHDCLPHGVKADILAGTHSQHVLVTAKIIAECEKGARGDDLRGFIAEQAMKDYGDAEMNTTGIDATMLNAIVTALLPGTGTATIGTVTVTAPIKCRFDSAMTTTDAGASTEWSTASGYTAGGVSVSTNWATAAAGSRATNAAVSVTNAPAQTWAGNELWDSSGTPLRSFYGALTGGNKTVNLGDTCTIGSGNLSGAITGH